MAVPKTAEMIRERLVAPRDRGIVALDEMDWKQGLQVMKACAPYLAVAKANSIAQNGGWARANQHTRAHNARLMADAKYKDTPRTMTAHVEANALTGSSLITVHISSGLASLKAAAKGRDLAREQLAEQNPGGTDPTIGSLLGITILTSYDDAECQRVFGDTVANKVRQFTGFAIEAGLEGIVCAADDLQIVAEVDGSEDLIKVVPGLVLAHPEVLPEGQQRVATVQDAIEQGADFAVLGSAVTKADNLVEAAVEANRQIATGLELRGGM